MSPSRTPLRRREPTRRNRGHLTILDAMDDENLFAPHFDNAETWVAWRAFLAVLFGLRLMKASASCSDSARDANTSTARDITRHGWSSAAAAGSLSPLRSSPCSSPASKTGNSISDPASAAPL